MPMSDASDGGSASDLEVTELDDLLEGRHHSGLHRLVVEDPPGEMAGVLGAAGWRVLAVTVDESTDKQAVLAGLAAAGGFPNWVGQNWDALLDALRDLSWAPADGYVVLIDGWARYVTSENGDAATLRSVLSDAAQWWDEAGTPFHILLRD
jgi:hypothetical protein